MRLQGCIRPQGEPVPEGCPREEHTNGTPPRGSMDLACHLLADCSWNLGWPGLTLQQPAGDLGQMSPLKLGSPPPPRLRLTGFAQRHLRDSLLVVSICLALGSPSGSLQSAPASARCHGTVSRRYAGSARQGR